MPDRGTELRPPQLVHLGLLHVGQQETIYQISDVYRCLGPASSTVTVSMGCTHNGVSTRFCYVAASLLTLGLQWLPWRLLNCSDITLHHLRESEPASSVIGGLGGWDHPLLLVRQVLTLCCCALL